MFELLFERSADAIWLLDPQTGVFVDCNQAAVDLLGADSKTRLLQARPDELSPLRQPDGSLSSDKAAEMSALAAQQGGHRFEWTARRFDDKEIPLEVLITPIPVGGRDLHVVVSRDISERKQAEAEIRRLNQSLEQRISERTAELAASEARFRALVEHAAEAIVVLDGQTGAFLFGNEHACRLYGVTADELTRLVPAAVSPEYQPDGRLSSVVAREAMDQALAGGTPVFEWHHRHASGRVIPTEVRLVRLPAENRQLLRASIIDNTERKRREAIQQATFQISEAVHTAEDLPSFYRRVHAIVQTLMPANNFYFALFEPAAGTIVFPYFIDEHGAPPAPLPLGKGLTSYVLRTGWPLLVGPDMNARKRRIGHEVTFEGYPDLRYVESGPPAAIWLGVPLRLNAKTIGVMAVQDYHDPTAYGDQEKQILTFVAEQAALALERKRGEAELRKMLAREKELSQLKSNFVSMVSHEFRTPLAVIQSSAEILRDYFDRLDPAERREQLQSVLKNTRRMGEMMEEILALSRLDSGKLECQPTPLDLNVFCRRVVDEVLSATDHRCPIELALAPALPLAQADQRLLSHVFTNLLTNAVKYSDAGRSVSLSLERARHEAVVIIRDQGIGIPAADQRWLFTAFQRGSNVGDRPGTGLGLVLVKRCVDLHGGALSLESKVGHGTTVVVRLPLFEAPA